MKLVQISREVMVNPEHVSHVVLRIETPLGAGHPDHEYPVYRITMYDGRWFDIAYLYEYPNDAYPFMALGPLLQLLTQ